MIRMCSSLFVGEVNSFHSYVIVTQTCEQMNGGVSSLYNAECVCGLLAVVVATDF